MPTEPQDPIVRMFRLPPPEPGSAWAVMAIAGVVVAVLVAWFLLDRRRRHRERRRADEGELRRTLRAARLDPMEAEAFGRLVLTTGRPALECASRGETFDRGVDALLRGIPGAELPRVLRSLRRKLGLQGIRPGEPVASTRALPPNLAVVVAPAGGPTPGWPVAATVLECTEERLTLRLEAAPGDVRDRLPPGCEAEVTFFNPLDAAYIFRAPVISLRELGAPFLVLAHPPSIARVQQRTDARVDVNEPVPARAVEEMNASTTGRRDLAKRGGRPFASGLITSISAGGIRLRTDLHLERRDLLELRLPFLPEPQDREPVFARVAVAHKPGVYGLRFEGMGARTQGAVLGFVRHVERERARREKEVEAEEVRQEEHEAPAEAAGPAPAAAVAVDVEPSLPADDRWPR